MIPFILYSGKGKIRIDQWLPPVRRGFDYEEAEQGNL